MVEIGCDSKFFGSPANREVVDKNYPLIAAAKNGHVEIVKLLLEDPRVDPEANENAALIVACQNNQLDVVKVVLLIISFFLLKVFDV